jgi:sigma-B regulation protein RsbU (phosphoserine phosphatase)
VAYFKGSGLPQDFFNGLLGTCGYPLFDSVVKHRASFFIEDLNADPRVTSVPIQSGPDSVITEITLIPLSSNTKENGFLPLADAHEFFTQTTTSILRSLGHLASVAYENALLREKEQEQMHRQQELELAQVIQGRLPVPEMPSINGLDLAGWSFPCDETGGDYLDVFNFGDDRCGIVVGDASGYGLGAALVMIGVRAGFMSLITTGQPMDQAFAQLSDRAEQDSPNDRFMTLFYGEFDTKARTLTYASGGHDDPLLYRSADGSIAHLQSTGLPIGMLPGMTYDSEVIADLSPGDILLASTDGITEAFSCTGEAFGGEQLEAILRDCSDESAGVITQKILDEVNTHVGTAPTTDDKTLLVVKVADLSLAG